VPAGTQSDSADHARHLYGFYIDALQHGPSNLYARGAMFRVLEKWRPSMLDAIMVIFGVGMFACFLGYTALCEGM
jgi:hypothetical protein